MDVLNPHVAYRVRVVAVHVYESLEAIFFSALKEPVNGSFLVDLYLVFVKFIYEIVADSFKWGISTIAESLCDKLQIFFQGIFSIYSFYEINKTGNNKVPPNVKTRICI